MRGIRPSPKTQSSLVSRLIIFIRYRSGGGVLKRFVGDERGNFAIFTGLLATILVGAMGGVLDLSTQWIDQSAVQRATDAAALAGAKALEAGTEADAREAIEIVAQANLPENFPAISFEATIDQTAGTVDVRGSGATSPYFLQLFDIDALPVGGKAQALIQRKSYIDFYFLLDVSESMNIAASDADREKLEAYTAKYYHAFYNNDVRECAFACHTLEWGATQTVYDLNKEAGARLRIDVLRDAAKAMVEKVLALNSAAGSLKTTRVGTSIFSERYLEKIAPSNDETAVQNSIDDTSGVASAHTNSTSAFADFRDTVGAQGTGKTQSDARKFAIIVTDGVRDENGTSTGNPLGTFVTAACADMKNRGIDVAVLDVKYQKYVDRFGYFNDRVASYYQNISPVLESCASSGLYYQATDSDEAETQLLKMVDDLLTIRRRLSS
ncbi:hypothetical protein D3218_00440 [Aureimonas flava]|uniref:VWFA domain-containing protein n=1 Tax=Aureimonas flava TaxID=2320271 RepID=A0A3A1WN03_9HYPH|nr:pilus assembly protein TadG-related protein [Aureimonas flava]RIY03278.1 hypothetical protein D3218_00440 [Aureimonas flava]